jgi:hypothetical protein
MKILYPLLNGFFHLFHVVLITFVIAGWMFPATRTAHLILVLLTLGSWFVLGIWMGMGYCPITEWHWKIKDALGEGRPGMSYVQFVLQKLLRRSLNAMAIDRAVTMLTVLLALASVVANVTPLLSR